MNRHGGLLGEGLEVGIPYGKSYFLPDKLMLSCAVTDHGAQFQQFGV